MTIKFGKIEHPLCKFRIVWVRREWESLKLLKRQRERCLVDSS